MNISDSRETKRIVIELFSNKREQQREFIEQHSTPLGAFAESAFAECGRGVIFIKWPNWAAQDWVYMPQADVFQCLKEIRFEPEETVGDDLLRALREYDPSWEAIIIFLNDLERGLDLHQVGFIPEGPADRYFAPPMRSHTNH